MTDAKHSALKQYWGYSSFRAVQEEIIDAVLAGNDVLALLPTGGGKSLCFQLPALLKEGLCIVITPLIALMQDQVEQLTRRGIKAVAINAGMSKREIDIAIDNCVYGNIKFLYLSPERLKTEVFRARVLKMKVALIAVDEAHCISQWGYDFRPAYLEIAEIRQLLPHTGVIALTATATVKVREDIADKLNFNVYKRFQKSFSRKNLSYSVRKVDDKPRKLLDVLRRVPGAAIVYVSTRKATKEVAIDLQKNGVTADFYHGGLQHADRINKQKSWISGHTRVMVATNAFGMGIDKPDVRLVVHLELPPNPESYYQEAGRAGRDEKKAFALIICNKSDTAELERRVRIQYPDISLMKRVYQSLANYYKLAVGSGGNVSYDLDIHDFSERYQLHHLEAYYSLKRLEEEGIIQLNEGFYAPSKVHITVDSTALYAFQIANARYDSLVKALLRLYGGELFTNFLRISEAQIAKFLHVGADAVKSSLEQLKAYGIVAYDARKDRPQLTFLEQRYAADALPLNTRRLNERKKDGLNKMQRMIAYVNTTDRCRTAQLLDYFGETDYDRCRVCDVCLEYNKRGYSQNTAHYYEQIRSALSTGALSIDELTRIIDPANKQEFVEVIRRLADVGQLEYDHLGRLKASAQKDN